MAYGIISYSQQNALSQPSGSIWGDCPSQELLDEGSGFFTYKTFVDDGTLPGLPSSAANSGTFTQDANFDHAMLMTTGASSGNGSIVYTRPTAQLAPGNGTDVWFEAAISLQDVTEVSGVFVGLVNKVGMTNALVQVASGTKASNLLTSVSQTSCVGFWMHGDTLGNFDAVWVNKVSGTGGLAPAAVNTVLANVLTANANNPNPGNPLFVPPTPPGVLTNNTVVKLGLRYDGLQYLYFYVNGNQVAKMIVSPSFDIVSTFGGCVALTTGAGAGHHLDVQFLRSASKLF